MLSWLDVPDYVAVPDCVSVDGAWLSLSSRHAENILLLSLRRVVHVHVEILLEEEGVSDLHLAMGGQAGTLVDEVVILLWPVNVDETLLAGSAASKL